MSSATMSRKFGFFRMIDLLLLTLPAGIVRHGFFGRTLVGWGKRRKIFGGERLFLEQKPRALVQQCAAFVQQCFRASVSLVDGQLDRSAADEFLPGLGSCP